MRGLGTLKTLSFRVHIVYFGLRISVDTASLAHDLSFKIISVFGSFARFLFASSFGFKSRMRYQLEPFHESIHGQRHAPLARLGCAAPGSNAVAVRKSWNDCHRPWSWWR